MLTIPQMILGKPKILVDTSVNIQDNYTILGCTIKNLIITNKYLKRLGVRRFAADLIAHFQIYAIRENGKGTLVSEETPCLWTTFGRNNKDDGRHISLPSSPVPASFTVVTYLAETEEVKTNEENITLLPGHYYVRIQITVDGDDIRRLYYFDVLDEHPFVSWVLGNN